MRLQQRAPFKQCRKKIKKNMTQTSLETSAKQINCRHFVMFAVYISMPFPYYRRESNQDRARE